MSAKSKNHSKVGLTEGRLEDNRAAADCLLKSYPAYFEGVLARRW